MDTFVSSKYLTRMSIFTFLVFVILAVLLPRFINAFQANIWFNAIIVAIALFGIVYAFTKVSRLSREIRWLDKALSPSSVPDRARPFVLSSLARQLQTHGRVRDWALAMDRIAQNLDESRQVARYLVGLLVFLGLLGTFWGLLKTIFAVAGTIDTLSMQDDAAQVFAELRDGLQEPLQGMGVAFSSSLFGLAGSLVVGFLELQVNQAYNGFLAHIEDRIRGNAHLVASSSTAAGAAGAAGPATTPAMDAAMIAQAAEVTHKLARTATQQQDMMQASGQAMLNVSNELSRLTKSLGAASEIIKETGAVQSELRASLARMATRASPPPQEIEQTLRSIAENLDRLLVEMSRGRQQGVADLRNELRILGRALTATQRPPIKK